MWPASVAFPMLLRSCRRLDVGALLLFLPSHLSMARVDPGGNRLLVVRGVKSNRAFAGPGVLREQCLQGCNRAKGGVWLGWCLTWQAGGTRKTRDDVVYSVF